MAATRMKANMHNSFQGKRSYSSNTVSRVTSGMSNNETTPLLAGGTVTTNPDEPSSSGADFFNSQNGGVAKAPRTPWRESSHTWIRVPASALYKFEQGLKERTNSESPLVRWPSLVIYTSWLVLISNYANVLLVFVPLGILAGAAGWDPVTVFVLNFLAIIPLAALLAFATEELSAKLGQTIGGLLNATFGNAVELIVSIVALRQGQIRIVQSSMLGSILSNILLVLGCCFIAGGLKKKEQNFDVTAASTMSSLMAVASASLIIPATLYAALKKSSEDTTNKNILILSHGTAIILLLLYVLYLYFQLYTHAELFDEEAHETTDSDTAVEDEDEDAVKEGDTLSPVAASIALVVITVQVAICAEYLVDSIDSLVQRIGISKTFIGLILLPIVGNAAEHVTAVVVSYKNKMNLALGVAIGSSMQIALFVTPALVILGWIIDMPMTLHFQTFETVVFFLSVLVVNYLIQDGKSNYLEGCMCLGTYVIIALAFYVYPDDKNIRDLFRGTP